MSIKFCKQSLKKPVLLCLGMVTIGTAAILSSATHAVAVKPQVNVGPIWNNADAKVKCPPAAAMFNREWNGQWVTTVPGQQSVCFLKDKKREQQQTIPSSSFRNK
jgi:Mannan-binding protein